MNFLFRPLWVFVAVTLPQLVLLGTGYGTYRIVESLLTERCLRTWAIAGGLLALLAAGFTILAAIAALTRRQLPTRIGPVLLVAYVPPLAALALNMQEIVPSTIPRWMLFHGDQLVLAYTLLMPALIYGLFLSVAWLTPEESARSAWKSFACAIAIPLGWYLVGAGAGAAWQSRTLAALLPYLLILSAVAFLFFLVRTTVIVMAKKTGFLRRFRPAWLAVVCLAFPQLGLALHGGILLGGKLPKAPFGDFSHLAFYLLAALNGIVLCLPTPRGTAARWGLAGARALLLPFTAFFFLVFLPYFPLSVLGVFAFGLGFLMLTPLLLMMVHAGMLREDFAHLRSVTGAAKSAATLFAAALVLPTVVVAVCLHDRSVLHEAIDYVSAPDYSTPQRPPVDAGSLARVLSHVRVHKTGSGREFFNEHVPYLSPLYQLLVLGNLTLADETIRELEIIFLGSTATPAVAPVSLASNPREIGISRISATSLSIEAGRAEQSTVELEITNTSDRTLEYASSFALPEGAWIDGFHLVIGDRREQGILAEHRAAAWVYRQIVAARRDPGILERQKDGRHALRVFPFAAGETRKTGFTVVHREPLLFRIDGKEHALAAGGVSSETAVVVRVGGGEIHYVPAAVKRTLPAVTRTPVLHFIVDCSVAAAPRRAEYIGRINRILSEERFRSATVRFTLADSGVISFDRDGTWEKRIAEHAGRGGFFLERSVKTILRRHFEERGPTYPILVVVTDALEGALVHDSLSSFSFAAPEADALYVLGPAGGLTAYRFYDLETPAAENATPVRPAHVLAYPDRAHPVAYLPDNGQCEVVIAGGDLFEREERVATSRWENALVLEGLWRALQLDPVGRKRIESIVIRRSLATGFMSPVTTYIALEDEAQKQALLAKQRQTLNAHGTLAVDESSFEQMSEPGWAPLLALMLLALFRRKRNLRCGRSSSS
jgi:hypothetical protein